MSDHSAPASPRLPARSHFDRRGATYDQAEVHHRVVAILAAGADIEPGLRVLDVATGTGFLAFEAAERVGPTGRVLGVDISKGMLAEAHRKAAEMKARNVEFVLGDAEWLDLPHGSFDRLTCASSLVLMADIPRALRHWSRSVKPGGLIAFDTPARPFGLSGLIAEVASRHGVHLRYADAADTPDKCHSLPEGGGVRRRGRHDRAGGHHFGRCRCSDRLLGHAPRPSRLAGAESGALGDARRRTVFLRRARRGRGDRRARPQRHSPELLVRT